MTDRSHAHGTPAANQPHCARVGDAQHEGSSRSYCHTRTFPIRAFPVDYSRTLWIRPAMDPVLLHHLLRHSYYQRTVDLQLCFTMLFVKPPLTFLPHTDSHNASQSNRFPLRCWRRYSGSRILSRLPFLLDLLSDHVRARIFIPSSTGDYRGIPSPGELGHGQILSK